MNQLEYFGTVPERAADLPATNLVVIILLLLWTAARQPKFEAWWRSSAHKPHFDVLGPRRFDGAVERLGGSRGAVCAAPRPAYPTTLFFALLVSMRADALASSGIEQIPISRPLRPLTVRPVCEVLKPADQRLSVFDDTGFNLPSRRPFCLRYVRESLQQASGVSVGEVETFEPHLAGHPEANVAFWRLWYVGQLPWSRKAITPASRLDAPPFGTVFDGIVVTDPVRQRSQRLESLPSC